LSIPQSYNRLLELITRMSLKMRRQIADKYRIEIPEDVEEYRLPEFLTQRLSEGEKSELLSDYYYAARAVTHFLTLGIRRRTPSMEELVSAAESLPATESLDPSRQDKPIFSYHDVDVKNKLIRLRFQYFHGLQRFFDPDTKTIKSVVPVKEGTVVIRPERTLFEARVTDRDMAMPIAFLAIKLMKLPVVFPLDLYSEKSVTRFLDWIDSLHNARFDYTEKEDISTISLSARGMTDLRGTTKFKQLFREGRLRGGHVTIQRGDHEINFRIFFRNTRVSFTSFSDEEDILLVAQALEDITEGKEFLGPRKLLEQYFH